MKNFLSTNCGGIKWHLSGKTEIGYTSFLMHVFAYNLN